MTSNSAKSTQRGIAFVVTLGLLLGMVPVVPAYAAAAISGNYLYEDGAKLNQDWKISVPQNGQFDYIGDQQTGVGKNVSQDIVGTAVNPAFYTRYSSTENMLAFRFRLNSQDGKTSQPTSYAYKNFAYVGVDLADSNNSFDGKLDFFIGIYNVNNGIKNQGRIGIYKSDPSKANASPATTGIINPPLVVKSPIPAYSGTGNLTADASGNFWIGDADTSLSINATANTDYFISFKIGLSDINTALRMMNKPPVTGSTGMRFMIGTASQDNSFNQDVSGTNGLNSKSSTTWSDLGVYTPTTSIDTISGTQTLYQVNFYKTTSSTTPIATMSALPGYSLGYVPTLANESPNYFLGWSTSTTSGITDFNKETKISGSINVYGIWTTSNYTVNFNDNPPTGYTAEAFLPLSVASGASIGSSIPLASHTGITFLGWNSSSTATAGTTTGWLSPATPITQDITYYAIWSVNYTVTFVLNPSDSSIVFITDNSGTTPLTSTLNQQWSIPGGYSLGSLPELTASTSTYYFREWNTSATGTGGQVYNQNTIINSSTTLYAILSTVQCTVQFWMNDGTGTKLNDSLVASGAAVGQLPTPVSSNIFDGWYTAPTGGELVREDRIVNTSPTAYYAHWVQFTTLKFMDGADVLVTRTGINGHLIETFPESPNKAGYEFKGWSTTVEGILSVATSTSITGDMTFYAVWAPIHTITFVTDGGINSPYATKSAVDGSAATIWPADPTKPGYTFTGWYTSNGSVFTRNMAVNADIDLYASWSAIQYTITFHNNDNSGSTVTHPAIYGTTLGSLYTPSRAGYTFGGWSSTAGGTADYTSMTAVTNSTTYYAVWTPEQYQINFWYYDGNVATTTAAYATSLGAFYGSDLNGLSGVSKTGYTLTGWSTTSEGSVTVNDSTTVSGITTYYAVWTPVIYTITFNIDGMILTGTGIYGTSLGALTGTTLGRAATVANKPGHYLLGWTTNAAATTSDASITETAIIIESSTYYAVWQHEVYTITFDYQGKLPNATGTGTDGDTLGALTGSTYGGATASTTPGYIITAWVTSPGGTTVTSGSIVTGSATYYASWSAIVYTINYHLDGGTNHASNPGIYTIESNFTLNDATKIGHTFAGWTTTSGSSVTVAGINAGSTGEVTLYAIWLANSYTLAYSSNGATSGTVPGGANHTYGSTVSVAAVGDLAKEGYTFTGWSLTSNGTTVNSVTIGTSDVTLYAIWALSQYTITYSSNGAVSGLAPSGGIHTSGSSVIVTGPDSLVKPGYTFTGWNTQSNGGGTQYTNGDSLIMSMSDLTLYASWTAINYTLTYSSNGATGGTVPDAGNYHIGDIVDVATNTGVLTKTGYNFAGWSTSESGSTISSVNFGSSNVTLYAIWTKNHYTLTFKSNDGSGDTTTSSIDYGDTMGASLPAVSRTGYSFSGWSTSSGAMENNFTSSTVVTGSATYYAIWTIKQYTVTYIASGTEVYATAGAAYQSTFGSILPAEPSRTGHLFGGWSETNGGTTSIAAMTQITENTTLYAIWMKETYQLTFFYLDEINQTTTKAVQYDDSLGTSLPAISRDYYKFEGWYSSPAGIDFTSSSAVKANQNFYARWTAILIKGIVKEDSGTLVSDASVEVSNSSIPFITSVSTSSIGTYTVNVPKDGVSYTIKITKPVKVGNTYVPMTFEQKNNVGQIDETNSESPSVKTLTGMVLEKTAGNITKTIGTSDLDNFNIDLLQSGTGNAVATNVGISNSGIFNISGLSTGAFQLVMKYYPVAGSNDYLVAGTKTVTITTSGEINIVQALVDPYGTIRDAVTNTLISGASVTLVYASGASVGPKVDLPEVMNFPPANNANPQQSDSNGQYAFMVYPMKDYYVLATKAGYLDYMSPLIHVDYDIVKHDFKMTPVAIQTGTGGNSSGNTPSIPPILPPVIDGKQRDLAITLVAEQMKLLEGSNGKLIIYAVNKSGAEMPETYVKVEIPENFQVPASVPGGTINGREITWNLGTLNPNTVKTINLELKVNNLNQGSLISTLKTMIGTKQNIILANPEDDLSILKLMLFSNRYQLSDKPYVTGYPDGDVKPLGKVTRAEVAAMFTRLLNLTNDPTKTIKFTNVPASEWYANYMEIMVEQRIFKGYEDGSIHPDQPITRAELGIAIARLLGIARENTGGELFRLSNFQDTGRHWAAATIEELYRFKVVSGNGSSFRPDDTITREESMKMINRLFYRGPLNGADPSFPDNIKDYWSFGEIEEAARDHSYQVNEDGSEQLIYESI